MYSFLALLVLYEVQLDNKECYFFFFALYFVPKVGPFSLYFVFSYQGSLFFRPAVQSFSRLFLRKAYYV